MGQLWYSPITINGGQVPTTQTDFPVLVSVTDARFKDVAHSGHVNRTDGFDIRPYTDTQLGTAITGYELERYVPTTGELIMWVKVASLSNSTTPIVLGYGDTTITTDGSSTTTWSNSFLGVYHLKDGTTLDVNSATGSNNGTNNSATAIAGQIDGAASFASVSSQYIDLGTGIAPTSITLSAWIKATTFPAAYQGIICRSGSGSNFADLLVKSTGKLAMYVTVVTTGSVAYDPGSHTMVTGTWYHVALTYTTVSSVGLTGYLNASLDGNVTNGNNLVTTSSNTNIGRDPNTASDFWNGIIDEVHIVSAARSADWITAEYNNQNIPSSFETLGAEASAVPITGLFTK